MNKCPASKKLGKSSSLLMSQAVAAIEGQNLSVLRKLLPEIARQDLVNYGKACPINGTLLHVALSKKDAPAALALLEAGAGAGHNLTDFRQVTPLMKAAEFSFELTRHLLEAGASLNLRDAFGRTALHHAAASILASVDVLRMLVDAGESVNPADNSGRTPLHSAVGIVDPEKVGLLLSKGADRGALAGGALGTPIDYLRTSVKDLPGVSAQNRERCLHLLSQQ